MAEPILPPSPAGDKLPFINGLRGIAILLVIFCHSFGALFTAGQPYQYLLGDAFRHVPIIAIGGRYGVELFFACSGFVLFLPYALGRRVMDDYGLRDYLIHRAARLLPLYYVVIVVCTLFTNPNTSVQPEFYRQLAAQIFLLFPFFDSTFKPPCNFVLWTLGVEIWFSILFPFFCVGFKRKPLLMMAFGLVLSYLSQCYFAERDIINRGLPGYLDMFFWGMLAASFRARFGNKFGNIPLWAGVALFFALTIMWANKSGYPMLGAHFTAYLGFSFFLTIIGGISIQKNLLKSAICNRPLQLIGMMCYSLYVWHMIIQSKILPEFGSNFFIVYSPRFLVYLAFLGLVSWFSYRFIEFGRQKNLAKILPKRLR